MTSNRPRQALHFYVLPRPVAVQIFTLLPLTSILSCSRTSRRIHTLITRSTEMQPLLFHSPPHTTSISVTGAVSLHPVFSRLNFSAFHAAKAVRVGNGRFLLTCGGVRHDFATAPAMREVIVRVVSGGEWPLDVEIAVVKEEGVTVWDVVEGVTGFFNDYSQISFGDHFGADFCALHEWDPKALMQNHEFLDPGLPFPTIYIPDRERNKVFIADYAFNEFAAGPLVLLPLEWRDQGRAAETAAVGAEEGPAGTSGAEVEVKDGGEVELAENIEPAEELTETMPDKKDTEDPEEKQDDPQQTKEAEDGSALGSMGSRSMDTDSDSENSGGFHINTITQHPTNPANSSSSSSSAAATHISQEDKTPAEPDERTLSFKICAPVSNTALPSTGLPPSTNTPAATPQNHILLTEVPPGAPAAVALITITPETLDSGTVDWEDAFD